MKHLLERSRSSRKFGKPAKIVVPHFGKIASGRDFQAIFRALAGLRFGRDNTARVYGHRGLPCVPDGELNVPINGISRHLRAVDKNLDTARVGFGS